MLPNLIVIGAQKSASTFIQECIAQHPAVYMIPGEAPAFESPDYEQGSLEDLAKAFEGKSHQIRAIKRPSYLGKSEVAQRIQRHLPEAKLLAVLRNPIDRAISAYFHNIKFGFIPNVSIETGMKHILDGEYKTKFPRSSEVIEYGFYHKHLLGYRHFSERSHLLVLLHEDILSNKRAIVQSVYGFLGIDSQFTPTALTSRPHRAVYHPLRLGILRARNRFWYRYGKDRMRLFERENNPFGMLLGQAITGFDGLILARTLNNNKPDISPDLKSRLQTLYREDIERLQEMIGRDLSRWMAE